MKQQHSLNSYVFHSLKQQRQVLETLQSLCWRLAVNHFGLLPFYCLWWFFFDSVVNFSILYFDSLLASAKWRLFSQTWLPHSQLPQSFLSFCCFSSVSLLEVSQVMSRSSIKDNSQRCRYFPQVLSYPYSFVVLFGYDFLLIMNLLKCRKKGAVLFKFYTDGRGETFVDKVTFIAILAWGAAS